MAKIKEKGGRGEILAKCRKLLYKTATKILFSLYVFEVTHRPRYFGTFLLHGNQIPTCDSRIELPRVISLILSFFGTISNKKR